MPASNSGELSRRNVLSAISGVFQIAAGVFSSFFNRLSVAVRTPTAANGDATGFAFDVRRRFHYPRENSERVTIRS